MLIENAKVEDSIFNSFGFEAADVIPNANRLKIKQNDEYKCIRQQVHLKILEIFKNAKKSTLKKHALSISQYVGIPIVNG